MAGGILWSDEEDALLHDRYARTRNSVLSDILREMGHVRSAVAIASRAAKLGLRKDPGAATWKMRNWTEEECEWIAGHANGRSSRELAEMFNEEFGRDVSREQIKRCARAMGAHMTRPQSFKPGHVPWNAGELLDEHVTPDGYTYVKVNPRNARTSHDEWVSKGRLVWEMRNARDWPDDCRCVFADGDRTNYDPENIVPVPNPIYVSTQRFGHFDAETTRVAMASAMVSKAIDRLMYPKRHEGE